MKRLLGTTNDRDGENTFQADSLGGASPNQLKKIEGQLILEKFEEMMVTNNQALKQFESQRLDILSKLKVLQMQVGQKFQQQQHLSLDDGGGVGNGKFLKKLKDELNYLYADDDQVSGNGVYDNADVEQIQIGFDNRI